MVDNLNLLKIFYLCSRHFYLFSVANNQSQDRISMQNLSQGVGTNLLEDVSGTVLITVPIKNNDNPTLRPT